MAKADKNDLIYFKQGCDKTYVTSKNANGSGIVQQTLDGLDVFPITKASAITMSDGKTLEEVIGGMGSIKRIDDVAIMGSTSLTSTGTYSYGFSFSPNNYNVGIESIEVTSDCAEVVIGSITQSEFVVNVNAIPAATDHEFTIVVKDKIGVVVTKEFAYTIKQEPTSLSISGSSSMDNEKTTNYTINYSPSTYNVAPTSVEITANKSSVTISNKTKTGFTFKPNLSSSSTVIITVKATLPSGKTITNTKSVAVNCIDYNAIDEYGVAIMDINGKFYQTASEWNAAGSPTANGIAISNGTHRFCIGKTIVTKVNEAGSYSDTDYWGAFNKTVIGTSSMSEALTDFNGVANTNAIVANVKSSDEYFTKSPYSAAGLCRQYTFPNGAKGYLGAAGEWKLVQDNFSKISSLMSWIAADGNFQSNSNYWPYYWTSNDPNEFLAYIWCFNEKSLGSFGKENYARVRAFCAI